MAPKKKPAFNGSKAAEKKAAAEALSVKRYGDAFKDLDRVRAWAREGRALLADALKHFPREIAAIRKAGDGDAYQALYETDGIDVLTAFAVGGIVRDDVEDPLAVIASLIAAETAVRALVEQMPKTALIDGTDAADTHMLRSRHTVEESARALGVSVDAIEKRRQRRRR